MTDEAAQEIRHGYLANISYLDAQIGKVLDELDRMRLSEKTVIVFWSDHGYHLGEHTLWAKTSNFELDDRVPLIIAIPDGSKIDQRHPPSSSGLKPGKPFTEKDDLLRSNNSIVELLDLYPTLVELCGCDAQSRKITAENRAWQVPILRMEVALGV